MQDAKPRGCLRLGSMESTASVRLPVPMNEYLSRYPEVSLELRIGTPRELAAAVREGELDAALVAEPIADAPFEKIPLYDEELVIIAAANHPPIKSPRDVNGRPVLAFEPAVPIANAWKIGSPAAARCPIASSKRRPTTRSSVARSPAWASPWSRGWCSRHFPT